MASVRWERTAVEALLQVARRDPRLAARINDAIYQYAELKRGNVRKLRDRQDVWRLRVGEWRVLFRQEGESILVLTVALRRDAYR